MNSLTIGQSFNIATLCERFGYPPQVRSLFEEIVTSVSAPNTRSVVLSGSASRGELVYAIEPDGSLRMYSDLELLAVADKHEAETIKESLKKINELERKQWRIGARTFHLDVEFISTRQWRRQQQRFQAWETRETGFVLFGEELLQQIQARVSPEAAIQSSLNRLWWLLLYLPNGLLRGQPTEHELRSFKYILSRAALDFPIWLLTSKKILVCGFEGRLLELKRIREGFHQDGFPIDELLSFVAEALAFRRTLEWEQTCGKLYSELLQWYLRMLSWALSEDVNSRNLSLALCKSEARLYPGAHWKRFLWEIMILGRVAGSFTSKTALGWLFQKKEILITIFLWEMNQAAVALLANNAGDAQIRLNSATENAKSLWPGRVTVPRPESHQELWLQLRREFFDFICLFFRGLSSKAEFYRFLLAGSEA